MLNRTAPSQTKKTPTPLDTPMNWNSHEQVLALFHVRGHPIPDTKTETIETLIGIDPLAPLLLEYREAKKRATTFGETWLDTHLRPNGRVYPQYHQLGSEAGRMSCSSPNIQQLPRDDAYRRCIRAPDGKAMVKADFSQIELRIAAARAPDEVMLAAFRNGEDIHRLTASRVFGVALSEVTKQQRQLAKSLNFGLLYGMGAKGLQKYVFSDCNIVLTEQEATRHRTAFFRTYPGLLRWHRRTNDQKSAYGVIDTRTMAGRRRRDVSAFTNLLNTPIQGTGADGLKLALALLYEHRHECPEARIIMCVHDEIVAECAVEHSAATAKWLERYMVQAMTEIVGTGVPCPVETTIGRDWAGTPL